MVGSPNSRPSNHAFERIGSAPTSIGRSRDDASGSKLKRTRCGPSASAPTTSRSARRKRGAAASLFSASSVNTTSSAVTGVPSANIASGRISKMIQSPPGMYSAWRATSPYTASGSSFAAVISVS
jgi:hypothetical protein